MEAEAMEINNEMYFQEDISWWDEGDDQETVFLRHFVNPIRFGFFHRIIGKMPRAMEEGKKILDVGCGGGFLAEEFAKIGFEVTGMDPAPPTLKAASRHAEQNHLQIRYIQGYGEEIPLETGSFDYVACCDVLEHVDDVEKVIREISRVLKPAGLFFYDTINRNLLSYLAVIKIAQDWRFTAWEMPRTHVWPKFIKPSELIALMEKYGLVNQEIKGISSGKNIFSILLAARQRAQGKISRYEMGVRMKLQESNQVKLSYMGYAFKK
jgi:2-polyprenyl-6-hydroxyphenyl methylase/3-demethylubiquinone-9 3-methyltransferase